MRNTKKTNWLRVFAWVIGTVLLIVTISLLLIAFLPALLKDCDSGDRHTSTMIVENAIPDLTVNPGTALTIEPLHIPHEVINSTNIKHVATLMPDNILLKAPTLATGKSLVIVKPDGKPELTKSAVDTFEVSDLKIPPRLDEKYLILPFVEDTINISIVDLPEESVIPNNPPNHLPTLENEDNVISPKMDSTRDQGGDIMKTPETQESDEIVSDSVLPSPLSTVSTSVKPAPFLDFVFPESKRPDRPAFTAEKVSAQYSYDFFTENVNYVTSVEICRQISRGSRLLSIESSHEKRIVDAYVKSHQIEIFGYKEDYLRYVWTGGYFDLDSHQPYALRWIDHPTPMEDFGYQKFCPESKDINVIIGQAISELKKRTLGLSNLNPCNRRWAHVIIDFTSNRIGQSCWQIHVGDVLSPDGLRLPFICKR